MSDTSNSNSSNSTSSSNGQKKNRWRTWFGKKTRDATTQCGQWLQVKKAIDTDLAFRAEVIHKLERVITVMGIPQPIELATEDDRLKVESGQEILSTQHIADLAVMTNRAGTCKWNL